MKIESILIKFGAPSHILTRFDLVLIHFGPTCEIHGNSNLTQKSIVCLTKWDLAYLGSVAGHAFYRAGPTKRMRQRRPASNRLGNREE